MKGHGGHTRKHAGGGKHAGSGKHRPMTASRHAAIQKWQQAGAKARHSHVVGSHSSHAKPSKWSPNLDVACCAAEALAASLRLTGHAVSAQDVLDLYWLTADHPDAGATIETTLEAAAEYGLAGVRPVGFGVAGGAAARESNPYTMPSSAAPGIPRQQPILIIGVDLAERHAVTVDGHGVWTWGEWRPVSCGLLAAADEAWEVTWP